MHGWKRSRYKDIRRDVAFYRVFKVIHGHRTISMDTALAVNELKGEEWRKKYIFRDLRVVLLFC